MSLNQGSLNRNNKINTGAPFPAGAADNGLSVDGVTGKIVLGNDETAIAGLAQLLSNREIALQNFFIRLMEIGGDETLAALKIESELYELSLSNFLFKVGIVGGLITKRCTTTTNSNLTVDGQADNFGIFQGTTPSP